MITSPINAVTEAARRWQNATGAFGVAVGPKRTDGQMVNREDRSLTFFVNEKKPRSGSRYRLADGRRLVPKRINIGDHDVVTDVIPIASATSKKMEPNVPRRASRTGGPLSDGARNMGTFGALVALDGRDDVYALTNQHVAIGTGNFVYFPHRGSRGSVRARVAVDRGRVADEQFVPFADRSGVYFDVDAALVQIPPGIQNRFSSDTPYLGDPVGIHKPDLTTATSYADSVLHAEVESYSWNSKVRQGMVSHVFLARRGGRGTTLIYCLVIEGRDGQLPSWKKDSGKLWCTSGANGEAVGLHQGSTELPDGPTRFAVATDMALLAKHLKFSLKRLP